MSAANLKLAVLKAQGYVEKIGQPQHHFRDGSVGKLHGVEVSTEIAFQATSGGQNYWKCIEFDAALERVIKAEFSALADKAISLMQADYVAARIAEKQSLLDQLAEIEAMERAQ